MRTLLQGIIVALVLPLLPGCAARSPSRALEVGVAGPAAPASLPEFMQKIRHVSAAPLPEEDAIATLESRDPGLAADLLTLSTHPTAERYRTVAERYRERGILDTAYRYFNRALALNPRDAAAYDGLARIWRDWRLPHLAVGDAHRATFYAPRSAAARNTYGTIMQALGRYADAQQAYELASRLDPEAAYAVNNLCYLSFLGGRIDAAIETCQTALRLDPSLTAARNNLALAFAASGRIDLARTHFLDAGDRAGALYNTGLVYLASGDYSSALEAFDGASRARPTFHLARERAQHIRSRLRIDTLSERLRATLVR